MIKNSFLKYVLSAISISALMFYTSIVFASGDVTPKNLISTAKKRCRELNEQQKQNLHDAKVLESKIDNGKPLSREENVTIRERAATIIHIIDNVNTKRPPELEEKFASGDVTPKNLISTAKKRGREFTSKNPFTKWTSKTENRSLILTQTDCANDKITEVLGSSRNASTKSNFRKLTKALPGTDGSNVVNIVAGILKDEKLSDAQKTEKTQELSDRLTPVSTDTDSIETTMSNASSSIGTRIISVAQPTIGTSVQSRSVASEKVSGISAGDDHTRYGAWFSPFFSKTTQKARKGAAGYRDTTYGGSFGMDTKANDDLMIGGAVSFANSEMKHRDFKSGDKTKVNSLMFSIYGLQNITDTWFAQGSFSIASNEVKNSERKVAGATAYETTNGKYNSMSFAGDVLFGYNYAVENFNLTPMGGLRYTRVNSAGYKMSGSDTGQNANISQKASNKLEVVVGARASGGTFDVNGMSITPEVHGFINHDLIGKNPKQDIRIGGVSDSLDAKSRKPIRTSYNLGLGVNANYGMMEYGAGYDLHLADKRVGHEGSLKVRVNF